jgi:hypothetical protein
MNFSSSLLEALIGGVCLASFFPPLMKNGIEAVVARVAIESCSVVSSLFSTGKCRTDPMRADLAAEDVVRSDADHLGVVCVGVEERAGESAELVNGLLRDQ